MKTIVMWFKNYDHVCFNLQNYSIRRGAGDFVISLFFLMEFTNPFLLTAMILRIVSATSAILLVSAEVH